MQCSCLTTQRYVTTSLPLAGAILPDILLDAKVNPGANRELPFIWTEVSRVGLELLLTFAAPGAV